MRCSTVQLSVANKSLYNHAHLVCRKQKYICTRRVHFVTFTWMNSLLLHSLDLQGFKLLIKNLALHEGERMNEELRSMVETYKVHDHTNIATEVSKLMKYIMPIPTSHELRNAWVQITTSSSVQPNSLFCHKWARNICIKLILRVGILPCLTECQATRRHIK